MISTRVITRTDTMRRLLKLVAHGYSRWTSGTVPESRAEGLAVKFSDRYHVAAGSQTRWRRKARGEANAMLVFHAGRDDQALTWWLLVTPGQGVVEQLEPLRPVGDPRSRITLDGGYELVQTPHKGDGVKWTWRMTKATVEAWEERIRTVIRSRSEDGIAQAIYSLQRVPGFHEARRQAFGLIRLAQAEWKRHRASGEECPFDGVFVPFVGRYRTPATAPVAPRRRKTRASA